MKPTLEQQAILDFAQQNQNNLMISALAGAAKTTTLEMICNKITNIPVLSLAFNKRIADEMVKRLPGHVEVRTLNALGHRVWGTTIGRRLVVDTGKMRTIVRSLIEELPRNQQGPAWGALGDTLDALRAAKRDGYVPPKWRGLASGFHAGSFDHWSATLDDDPDADLLDAALSASIEAAYAGGIDYDDQIYMPVCFGASWPKFPLVLIDEFQDLNELQHEMLAKLVTKRLIGVGDPWQSIYAFRGAKQNGMTVARERWSMEELPLSVTFRVPRCGVERARSRVPHMQWCNWAEEGSIQTLSEWDADTIKADSAIICRSNAPLFRCALRLLSRGRRIKLVGMDIGPGLIRLLKRLGPLSQTEAINHRAIEEWAAGEERKGKNPAGVADRKDCLHVLCEGRGTLGEAIKWADDLFKQEGEIQLLSGHKAKGLEWDTVYHLDPWRIPSKFTKEGTSEWEQELNVRYVIETRFKKELFLMDLEGWR